MHGHGHFYFSGSAIHYTHTVHLIDVGWLQSIVSAFVSGDPMVLLSSLCLSPYFKYFKLGHTFTNNLSCTLRVPSLICLDDAFMPSKQVLPRKLLYITMFDCQHEVQTWLSLHYSFSVLTLRKHFHKDLASMTLIYS